MGLIPMGFDNGETSANITDSLSGNGTLRSGFGKVYKHDNVLQIESSKYDLTNVTASGTVVAQLSSGYRPSAERRITGMVLLSGLSVFYPAYFVVGTDGKITVSLNSNQMVAFTIATCTLA